MKITGVRLVALVTLVLAAHGCATASSIAISPAGTVYVVRGDRVYDCGNDGNSCNARGTLTSP